MSRRRPWMPLYIADYLADTGHLTTLQHGAYLLLIMHYWQHGGLPQDDRALAQAVHLSVRAWRSNRSAIASMFQPGWRHKRIDMELSKFSELSEKRAINGAVGGRLNRGLNNQQRHLRKMNSEAIAKQMVGPHTHKSSINSKSERARAREGSPQEVADQTEEPEKPEDHSKSAASGQLEAIMRAKRWI
jgi:uncharacterized protein YdaU (DUF1376 family)